MEGDVRFSIPKKAHAYKNSIGLSHKTHIMSCEINPIGFWWIYLHPLCCFAALRIVDNAGSIICFEEILCFPF